MAAARGGVNFVRIFFYNGNTISAERKKSLVALAYATARDQPAGSQGNFDSMRVSINTDVKLFLTRSDMHNTTTNKSGHVIDPKGWHGTFAFKASDQLLREYHVASHGYTNGKEDFTLKEATHTSEKADNTRRGGPQSDKVVWPPEEFLEEYKESPIGYSHLSGQG